ncbi:hypothetical protein HQ533_00780 [Candidatus Woesearchaeota archaeon]|nr:hypothetical protein [Candidatus Woesearchaeota archaeon]
MRFIIPIIISILIIGLVVAQPPPPPPPPPIFGDVDPNGDENDSVSSAPPPPPPPPNFGDAGDDEEEEVVEEPEEKQECPKVECPAPSRRGTYTLLFLVIVLLGVIGFLLLQKSKSQPVVEEPKAEETKPQDDDLEPLRNYVNGCRLQGFMDEDIKLELMKNGYSTELINKLF